jgi:MYXO-CTERM domain-containing protein
VAVSFSDASGVKDTGGNEVPINAIASADGGNNINWVFQGGGALTALGGTALTSGGGRLDRVRVTYSRKLDLTTVGSVFLDYQLQQLDSKGKVLQSITGTGTNLVQSTAGNKLDILFGNGLGRTDVTNVAVVYTAPPGGFLASFDGIPASQNQTIGSTGNAPLVDGAPPALLSVFAQDTDNNGGVDILQLTFSEPVAFAPGVGTSVSDWNPATDTTTLNGATDLYLQIAGETLPPIKLDRLGPQFSGSTIAAVIQDAVVKLMNQPVLVSGHNPLNRPAYLNFTCKFVNGRYSLQAGVPLAFNSATGTYSQNYGGSTVHVVSGANDAAPFLKLGVANGGVEASGAGNANAGTSSSGAITGAGSLANGKATFQINGEDFRTYTVFAGATTLETVAQSLESQVRNTTSEALFVPNQAGYTNFVVVPDASRSQLVFVSGSVGPGSSVVFSSQSGIATIAPLGSSSFPAAHETAGKSNSLTSLAGLNVRGQDGSNLLLGKTNSDLQVKGNVVTVNLFNIPTSGVGTPAFLWQDPGNGAFLDDLATVPNVMTATFTDTGSVSNAILTGAGGSLKLQAQPGTITLDAEQSIALIGSQGTSVAFVWSFTNGPVNPQNVTWPSKGPTVTFFTDTSGAYFLDLRLTGSDAGAKPVVSLLTNDVGDQVVQVEVDVASPPPIASAGPNETVIGTSATLNGTGSIDPNGGPVTVFWSAINTATGLPLPSGVFNDPSSLTPVFTPGAPGNYTVTITVTKTANGTTTTASDSAQLTFATSATTLPVANAGPDQTVRINVIVTLDASASASPSGSGLKYKWSVASSPATVTLSDSTAIKPTFLPSVVGNYVFSLVVSDGNNTSVPSTTTVIAVDDTSALPRLAPAAEPRAAELVNGVFLTTAPTGDLTKTPPTLLLADDSTRTIDVVDLAGASTHPDPSTVKNLRKVLIFTGTTLFATLYAEAQPGDADPLRLNFKDGTSADVISYGVVGQPFVLDGTRSHDAQVVTGYQWTQVSGPPVFTGNSGDLIGVTPTQPGLYVFSLTVTNSLGLSSFARQVSVRIEPSAAVDAGPPTAVLGLTTGGVLATAATDHMHSDLYQPLVVTTTAGSAVTLDGSKSISRNGGNVTFRWTLLDGPIVAINAATGASFTITPPVPGAYELALTVTDSNGVSDTEIVWVTVGALGEVAPVAVLKPVASPQTIPASGSLAITLDGTGSLGRGLTYHWTQRGGVPAVVSTSGGTGSIVLTQPGDYEFELRVSDGSVTSAPAIVSFRATAAPDSKLTSGTFVSSSSGGCRVGIAPNGTGWPAALPLAAIFLVLVRSRRRASRRASP